MKKVLTQSLVLALGVALVSSAAYAKKGTSGYGSYSRTANWSDVMSGDNPAAAQRNNGGLNASAAATTVVLNSSKFDSGASCVANSWTTVDITQQTGDWWHVDNFTTAPWAGTKSTGGITFNPVQGTRSMWMAALPPTGPLNTILCGYAALPGYGNGWNQAFCSKACLAISGGPDATKLDVAFKLKFDSEPSYDGTALEYTTDCAGNVGWTEIAGGTTPAAPAGGWSGPDSISVANSYTVSGSTVRVRLHFTADTSWSNQDGFYPGFGVAVDSLKAENLAVEGFESTALGSNQSTDWQSCNTPGYGNYLALFKKATGANYEDQCLDNLGCYWAAISGSTEFYTCGNPSQPSQKVVPHVNVRGEYLSNEIWSPVMSLSGSSGSDFRLRGTVYRDLPLDNLIFYVWHVRTIDTGGCPGAWADRNFVYYGDAKNWQIDENLIGSKVNVATGASIQVAWGVLDMCPFWCGIFGTGLCHSPAPYIDSVKVLRIDTIGPQWDVRDIDTFNDNFSSDGTITGTARIDEAIDIKPSASPTFTPGDSAIVLFLLDPKYQNASFTTTSAGLSNDPTASTFVGRNKTKNAVYGYFTVTPFNATKIGPAISEGPGGTANRYPYVGSVSAGGKTWAKVRMDYTYTGTAAVPGLGTGTQPRVTQRYNIDINDNLFTPGDTLEYFYSATSADGTTYFSTNWGATSVIGDVAANPMEVTILPAGGFNRGGDILYVDGADGFGVQPYFDGAFMDIGLANKVDRFDVRGPSSGVSNRLGGRVVNVANQLNACYAKIIWDSGPLSITLGDGTGDPEKTDDYATMNTFLNNLSPGVKGNGGVMLLGDRQGETLNSYAGASAVTFRSTDMPFTLINNNHRLAPTSFAISPKMMFWPGRAYSDNFTLFGGCPGLNDFDVLGASGTSLVQMSYNTASNANGGVISHQRVNGNGATATVLQTGFSLLYVRDDELDGISDKAKFLHSSITFMGNILGPTIGAGPALKNSLSQNYPNPFNPQTSIAFTIKDRGAVSLKVYNVNGELVRTLANDSRAAGSYTLVWDGHNDAGQPVSSGVYFYKLVTNNFSQTKKMVLLK
ncbi:MAG TPA: T9SS type A sorting domain-containing protein [Candidatus Krumholzibacteria bacterium]|nr:T9SS type A sorting domain-containing protein [Candidatus Krumholzibacteria bacterium]